MLPVGNGCPRRAARKTPLPAGVDVSDEDPSRAAVRRADNPGSRVAVKQNFRVCLQHHRPVLQHLRHQEVALGSLGHHVGVAGQRLRAHRHRLHILRHLRQPLALPDGRLGAVHGCLHGCTDRKGDAQDLLAFELLSGAQLQAAASVDAEPHAVLGGLVKDWRRRVVLAGGERERIRVRPVVLRPNIGPTRHPLKHLPARDLEGRGPIGREQRAGVAHNEPLAAEVLLPPLPHRRLLLNELAQLLHVTESSVRRHELVAIAAPVRQARVEDRTEQGAVQLAKGRRLGLRRDARPEAPGRGGVLRVAPPAAGGPLGLLAGGRAQVEAREVQVHALEVRLGLDARTQGLPGQGRPQLPHAGDAKHPRHLGCSAACEHRPRGEAWPGDAEPVQAKLDAPVHAVLLGADPLLGLHDLAVLHGHPGVAAVVPQLRDHQ
mmetsp:Transcript_2678/g.8975  ORF Transcript_2678/g.8975 Transcript_2678/m.8975 type:complete len:433 (-) Transcript_2678:1909-3207(-)